MQDDPIAYFITWTCYGTFLPGDDRGWTKWQKGQQLPQPRLADWCRDQMIESPVCLDQCQRQIVNQAISDHCHIRTWYLHTINCRSNHCHVVVTAPDYKGELVRDQFKSWGKRRLKENETETRSRLGEKGSKPRDHWWTRKGSVRHLFDDESLDAAILYTTEAQDVGGSKYN